MALTLTPNSGCAYILDTGNTQDAFNISGNGSLTATSCSVHVWSSNSKALEVSGNASLSAQSYVHGNYNCNGGATCPPAFPAASPNITSGVAVPATTSTAFNPLVNLPTPAVGSCSFGTGSTPYSISSTPAQPISHGTYCGGITVSGGTLTLNSGIYILNGGGLTVSSNSGAIIGSNVMFFFTGQGAESGKQNPLVVSGGASINLTAPSSGPYMGVLFFQDPGATYNGQNTLSGGSTFTGSGTWYFPTTTLTFSGSSAANSTMAFIVKDLTISGNATVNQDTTGILTGLAARRPGLIQ